MLKQETLNLLEDANFKEIFSICIGKTYINQKRFKEYIGKYNRWDVNIDKGILQLDYKRFNVEFIGTTSVSDNYWYSSEIEKVIPNKYVKMMTKIREKMEKLNFEDLSKEKIVLQNEKNGYNLSMIYIAFAQKNVAYFNGSGDTSLYMFVKDLPDELFKRMNSIEFSSSTMEIVSNFDVNHRLLIKAMLLENDYEYEEKDNNIIAKFTDKSIMTVKFDDYDRVIGISGVLST